MTFKNNNKMENKEKKKYVKEWEGLKVGDIIHKTKDELIYIGYPEIQIRTEDYKIEVIKDKELSELFMNSEIDVPQSKGVIPSIFQENEA